MPDGSTPTPPKAAKPKRRKSPKPKVSAPAKVPAGLAAIRRDFLAAFDALAAAVAKPVPAGVDQKTVARIEKLEARNKSLQQRLDFLNNRTRAEGPDRETGERLTELETRYFSITETIEIMRGRLRILETPPTKTVEQRLSDIELLLEGQQPQDPLAEFRNGTDG